MSAQNSLCFSYEEALGDDIKALGGRKKVAARLWPGEDEETANSRMKASLAPGHKQRLSYSEVLTIKEWARDVGSYATVAFEAQQLSYRYEWIDPQDEADQMRREVRDLLSEVSRKMDRIERADQRTQLKAVGK